MSANYISARVRQAAPELCREIEQLRVERKPLCERLSYLNASGAAGAAEVQQRISAIDAKVAALHARAKQQLLNGLATDLARGATNLQSAQMTAEAIRVTMIQETDRHSDLIRYLVAKQEELVPTIQGAINTMRESAENITDGDQAQEQSPQPDVVAAGGERKTSFGRELD